MKLRERLNIFMRYQKANNRLLRVICKPIMDYRRRLVYEEYLNSGYPEKMRAMKDSHKGERCFIIGNGPSLTAADLSKLNGEYTFGANRIFEIFDQTDWRPTFYVSVDPRFFEDSYEEIYANQMQQYFLEYQKLRSKPSRDDTIGFFKLPFFQVNVYDFHPYISEKLELGCSDGGTVTFISIQLALYMGFEEIYLLGVDFNYSVVRDAKGKITRNKDVVDYFSGHPTPWSLLNLDSSLRAYQVTKAYCDEHGVVIKNATRGGKLEVFERVDFDELMKGNQ